MAGQLVSRNPLGAPLIIIKFVLTWSVDVNKVITDINLT